MLYDPFSLSALAEHKRDYFLHQAEAVRLQREARQAKIKKIVAAVPALPRFLRRAMARG